MKNLFQTLVFVMSASLLLTACLKKDDEDTTYYSDAAITSFQLGTVKRLITVKRSDGTDSTYWTSYAAGGYHFYVDQLNNVIYNPDSLLKGTKVSRMLCNITTYHNGVVYYLRNDSMFMYSSADSLDFSDSLKLRVYANDAMTWRDYVVTVRVHEEEGDSMNWTELTPTVQADFRTARAMKAVAAGGRMFVFALQADGTHVYNTSDGQTWTEGTVVLGDSAWMSAVATGGQLYTLCAGKLWTSADGSSWDFLAQADGKERLAAAGSKDLYAIATDGSIHAFDRTTTTWRQESADDEWTWMPKEDLTYVVMPIAGNGKAERVVVMGNRKQEEHAKDTIALVWNKINEFAQGSHTYNWMRTTNIDVLANENMPRLTGVAMAAYDGDLIAIGGQPKGDTKATAFRYFYRSKDKGIIWRADKELNVPEGFSADDVFALCTDENQFVWLFSGKTGTVWKGRHNRLGWKTEEKAYFR